MSHTLSIVSRSYIVPDELLDNPLYLDWSHKTIAQVVSAKADLITAINSIIPTQDNQLIVAYLVNLLLIVVTLAS